MPAQMNLIDNKITRRHHLSQFNEPEIKSDVLLINDKTKVHSIRSFVRTQTDKLQECIDCKLVIAACCDCRYAAHFKANVTL